MTSSPLELVSSPLVPAQRSSGDAAPLFAVRIHLAAGTVELEGVLDRRTAHLFSDALRTLQAADRPEWVIDAAGLRGCDAAGLRALGNAYRRAIGRGRRVVVRSAPPWLCSALARVRLDTHVLPDPPGR